jgi:Leucine-rich repeat (LRR) protein
MDNNEIFLLPPEISLLLSLNTLSIKKNKLVELPLDIGCIRSLSYLHADHNGLTLVHYDVGMCELLIEVTLTCNQLKSVPWSFEICVSSRFCYFATTLLSHSQSK